MAYLTTAEVAARLRRSRRTVEEWRQLGRGPRFVRQYGRVLYPTADLEKYERELYRSTA